MTLYTGKFPYRSGCNENLNKESKCSTQSNNLQKDFKCFTQKRKYENDWEIGLNREWVRGSQIFYKSSCGSFEISQIPQILRYQSAY